MMKKILNIIVLFLMVCLIASCGGGSSDMSQKNVDYKAITLIREFYNKYVFAPYEFFAGEDEAFKEMTLNNYCTKKLMQG